MIDLFDPLDRTKKLNFHDGYYVSELGNKYPVIDEIPRFVSYGDPGQLQTSDAFGYKWSKQPDWGFKPEHQDVVWSFWKETYGWDGPHELKKIMEGKIVLDAGCGSGASMRQFIHWPAELIGVDISKAVDSCKTNFKYASNLKLFQADICKLPFANEQFDIVWSAGVLHHTPNTYESLKAITRHAKKGGLVIFYVYKKKAPIREFVDDYLRDIISEMSPDKAWERMEIFTRFAKALSETDSEIVLDDDFPELGFKKGKFNLQRFIYYNMLKCYWNPNINFDDNVHVNFDWYYPKYSHRQTPGEVKKWLAELKLKERTFFVSDSGISVVAER